MYKLTILFRTPPDLARFEQDWALSFVPLAEAMPGILRVEVGTVDGGPDGPADIHKIHEFYFESRETLDRAMHSDTGARTGAVLNAIAPKRFSLLFAEVHEDVVRPGGQPPEAAAPAARQV
jgi:uncharacterized protein (TIGR02118 family)